MRWDSPSLSFLTLSTQGSLLAAAFSKLGSLSWSGYVRERLEPVTPGYGIANATYASPDRVPSLPPPAAITTYCLPRTAKVLGVA